jgi:plasmid stability protein
MADQDTRMVLRTVYLTPEVDEKLRIGAFQAGRSKNDLIRDAITQFLTGAGKAKAYAKIRSEGVAKKTQREKAPAKHKLVKASAAAG